LWAERFDRDLDDIFAVQDEVTAEIVAALKIKLSREDEQRIGRRATTDVENYEIYLRARKKLWSASKPAVLEARAMFDEVLARDPDFAPALGGRAIAMISLYTNQWTDDLETAWEEAVDFAERAVAADDNEAGAHLALGIVRSWQKRREEARNHGRRVLELSPNNPEGHALLSNIEYYAGDFRLAIEEAEAALRVDPHSPDLVWQLIDQAAYIAGDYDKAATALIKRIKLNPATDTSHLYLAATYGRLGEADEATFEWSEIFRANPAYSLADRIRSWPFADPEMYKRILQGLEMAGIDHQIPSDA
jgi:tetratricopeptide (TPR) repeat protein